MNVISPFFAFSFSYLRLFPYFCVIKVHSKSQSLITVISQSSWKYMVAGVWERLSSAKVNF